ncbi:MAG: peptidylprolyl isomerase [Hydrogenophilales bacterium CG03_land_8_20_14_0_80_62_28]|nr:peptidylprolyl isomerase [Betaproteobacteria bacterium]OIO80009.1 MAG: peptidylprolyl isomerase [Hydrogenophilaceae bacterium CG1_02_62_390]PIV22802.1 MAG: peptidylprolyl isomerase [Hydrogenophilales bacterium CG03_land_8_20_14_0_80_62_28]PIW39481.1 MAG: peptidylprolyl isomerase [Hydrogenophilales bacterium CG15_BIG_FIL_POST_REV_8_21_14_020_62_31]PIW72695.1 MAG: peptidylprolyl isomerase [Hydrogenophilales bacterium CG12_big_fil_rev_8_21_14_0_65_61_21]PIX01492.1 MAG: peptidylprolyl isomerase
MRIAKDTVVKLSYRLTTLQGELLEEATVDEPAVYLHGGYDGIFEKVEEALEGKVAGAEADLVLEPQDAFGDYDAELVRMEDLDQFPSNVEVGMQFEGVTEDGRHRLLYTVTDVADGKVVVDGNHALAGHGLRVQCRVEAVRAASAEEIAHGHVHGAGEHHHGH